MLILMWIFIVVTVIHLCDGQLQPSCSTENFPPVLPIHIKQALVINLNNYFSGPNLTISLLTQNPNISVASKIAMSSQKHNLGTILSISQSANTVTMLGVTSTKQYYIYHANVDTPHQIAAQEVPESLKNCVKHEMSGSGATVVVTCQGSQHGNVTYSLAVLNLSAKSWFVFHNQILIFSTSRQIYYIQEEKAVVIIQDRINSYIQLWDLKYGRLMLVYDRSSLKLAVLNIMDAKAVDNHLYILDYQTGIYKLKLNFDRLEVDGTLAFAKLEKLAVTDDHILILVSQGSITEDRGDKLFKYDTINDHVITSVETSLTFIIVYMDDNVIVYFRGINTPYIVIPVRANYALGTFTKQENLLQVQNPKASITSQSSSEIDFKIIKFSAPTLTAPHLEETGLTIDVTLIAESFLLGNSKECKIQSQIQLLGQDTDKIFETTAAKIDSSIFMNRPGRAIIPLSPYGFGSNLVYSIYKYDAKLNIGVEIRKLNQITFESTIEGISEFNASNSYFSRQCREESECPLILSTSGVLIRFYKCTIKSNFFSIIGVNCTQVHRQSQFSRIIVYQVTRLSSNSFEFVVSLVTERESNTIVLIKYQSPKNDNQQLSSSSKSSLDSYIIARIQMDDALPPILNITQAVYSNSDQLLFVLIKAIKEIRIYQIVQSEGGSKLWKTINLETLSPKPTVFNPQKMQLGDNSLLYISNYDQILVLDYLAEQTLINVISVIELEFAMWFCELQIVTDQSIHMRKKTTDVYLVVSKFPDILRFCYLDKYHKCAYQFKYLPLFYHKSDIELDEGENVMQSLGGGKVSIKVRNMTSLQRFLQIYDLSSESTITSRYSMTQQDSATVARNYTLLPVYFHLGSKAPVIVELQSQKLVELTTVRFHELLLEPTLSLVLPNTYSEAIDENLILYVENQDEFKKHVLNIHIANYPESLSKGSLYPFSTIRKSAENQYVQIDVRGWLSGNVLNYSYACQQCDVPQQDQAHGYIETRHKIWQKQHFEVLGAEGFNTLSPESAHITMFQHNAIYQLNTETHTISDFYLITQSSGDSIKQLRIDPDNKLISVLVIGNEGRYSIVMFSTASQKGFQVSRILLPESVRTVDSFDYVENVVIAAETDGVFIYFVDREGQIKVVEYVDEVDDICWAELLKYPNSTSKYFLIITLCDTGISTISFNISRSQNLQVTSKQIIDLSADLIYSNIRLPTDASFIRTLTVFNERGYSLLCIIKNFNSIKWQMYPNQQGIVTSSRIVAMIHRYGDFSATPSLSVEPLSSRYMNLLYHGTINGVNKYINAVYDLSDFTHSQQQYEDCYIMEAVISSHHKIAKFMSSQTLTTLSTEGKQEITIYNVSNTFRAVVHNGSFVYSQPIFMIASTPASSMSIQIYIEGLDLHTWVLWEILLIVLALSVVVVLLGFIFRRVMNKYEQKQKLMPLLIDYPDYEQDMQEQFERRESNRNGQTIMEEISDQSDQATGYRINNSGYSQT